MAQPRQRRGAVESADVVIVGGGIVGSAVAYFLSSDGAFQGRRIVLIERDPSYAEASTARSAGGLRQQFSTPENIAMSQFTLSLIRQLKAMFGPDADVGFREQGYLITGDAEAASALLAENVALQQSHGADIVLLDAAELAQPLPLDGDARASPPAPSADRARAGSIRRASPSLLRNAAKARGVAILHDRVTAIEAQRPRRSGPAGERRHGSRAGRWSTRPEPGPASWRRWPACALPVEPRKRYVYVIDCREAPEALHQAPLTVDPSGVWFRPEGRFFLCGKSPEEERGAARHRPRRHRPRLLRAARCGRGSPQRVPAFESVKVVNAWAGYYDYNTLDQNAVIGPHPAACQPLLRQRLLGPRRAAGGGGRARDRRADRARRLPDHRPDPPGLRRIAEGRPLLERNVI